MKAMSGIFPTSLFLCSFFDEVSSTIHNPLFTIDACSLGLGWLLDIAVVGLLHVNEFLDASCGSNRQEAAEANRVPRAVTIISVLKLRRGKRRTVDHVLGSQLYGKREL